MVAPPHEEIIVVRYTNNSKLTHNEEKVWMHESGFSSFGTSYIVSDWYRRIIFRERYEKPRDTKIKFFEWSAVVNRRQAFKIKDQMYEDIIIILGSELCYWAYFTRAGTKRSRVEGSAPLNIPHCACCIDKRYIEILDYIVKISHK